MKRILLRSSGTLTWRRSVAASRLSSTQIRCFSGAPNLQDQQPSLKSVDRGYDSVQTRQFRRDMQHDAQSNVLAAQAMIESKVGSMTPKAWMDADDLMHWWSIQRSVESVITSFALLDRLLEERKYYFMSETTSATDDNDSWIDTTLLNRILNNWRVVWWSDEREQLRMEQLTPRLVWERLEQIFVRYNFPMNEKSLYLVLEAEHAQSSDAGDQRNHMATPDMAEQLLNRSFELHDTYRLPDCLPSTNLCNLVMRSWNLSGRTREAPLKCEAIYERMIQYQIPINARTYRAILHAWARIGTEAGIERAHEWLHRMHANYLAGDETLKPDSAALAIVIAAYSRSKQHDAGQKAVELYRHLGDLVQYNKIHVFNSLLTCFAKTKRKHDVQHALRLFQEHASPNISTVENSNLLSPNATTYLILITAFAKVGQPEKAEALLQEMHAGFAAGHDNLKPTNFHFTSVISAFAQSDRKNKVEKIKAIMDRMEELSRLEDDDSLMPSLTTYNAYLACFANGAIPFAGPEAERILQKLKMRADAGDARYTPDKFSYTAVINAYAKTGLSERAVGILNDMENDFYSGNDAARPDLYAYNTVLGSFSTDRRSTNAGEQACRFLDGMKALAAKGSIEAPDLVSYSALINAFANSKGDDKVGSAERAEGVLRELQAAYKNGDESLRPNQIAFNACINAWARAGCCDRASDLLREMYLDYQNGNHKACPDVTSFNTLLKAFASAKGADAGEKAQEIIDRMNDLHKSGVMHVRPNSVTYTTLVLCHVFSGKPGSLERAEKVLRLMDQLYERGELDQGATKQAFDTIRRGWVNSRLPERYTRSNMLRYKMKTRFGPSSGKRNAKRSSGDQVESAGI
ncbi:hypothetical protein MPSEU_000728300 [Mayamaea pseudoterrestris]|nr:hypothetical protein MPSEU_000727800 [Mayamaea pseudoterrestris]GKY97701.1 hypothetical protein MPSEU_000728300 [Mayamaea pseudoterrestris]